MDVKKAIRKIVAIGTGATMVGATLFGAMATADLANYPAPFVNNGQFNAVMVIGKESQAIDNMAMTNIATGLQVASGAKISGTSTATGDSVVLDGGKSALYLNAAMTQTLGDGDLSILSDGTFTESKGIHDNDMDYSQFLKIDPLGDVGVVKYQEDTEKDKNDAGMLLEVPDSSTIYEYTLNFKSPVKIDHDAAKADMLASEINMLGQNFLITDTTVDGTTNLVSDIKMLTGSVEATQNYNTKQTYTIDGKNYEIEVVMISATQAKFKVNGEISDAMIVGQSQKVGGIRLGVKEVLTSAKEAVPDQVSFYLGSRNLELKDASELKVNDDAISGSTVTLTGSGTADTASLTGITIDVTRDGDNLFLKAGDKLDDPAFGAFNLNFAGLKEDSTNNVVKITGSSTSGSISFTNSVGDDIKIDMSTDTNNAYLGKTAVAGAFLADGEQFTPTAADTDTTAREFLVSTDASGTATHLFKITRVVSDATPAPTTIRISDVTAGIDEDIILGTDATHPVDKAYHTTLFGAYNIDVVTAKPKVKVQTDTLAPIEGRVFLTTGIDASIPTPGTNEQIKLRNQASMTINEATPNTMDPVVYVSEDQVRDGSELKAAITYTADDEIGIVQGDVTLAAGLGLVAANSDSNSYKAYTSWGAVVDWNKDNEDLTITSPKDQTEVQVNVNEAGVAAVSIAGASSSAVSISVDATIFDNELASLSGQNTIIIGGGCVNKWAAEVLGVPFKEYPACAQGLPEGQAVIKLKEYGDKVALVAAGGTGDDTRRAGIVLNQYKTYALSGMEAKVTGTDFTNIQVSKVQ